MCRYILLRRLLTSCKVVFGDLYAVGGDGEVSFRHFFPNLVDDFWIFTLIRLDEHARHMRVATHAQTANNQFQTSVVWSLRSNSSGLLSRCRLYSIPWLRISLCPSFTPFVLHPFNTPCTHAHIHTHRRSEGCSCLLSFGFWLYVRFSARRPCRGSPSPLHLLR